MIFIDKYFFHKTTPRLLIFVMVLFGTGSVWGQASGYSFSASTGASLINPTYTTIINSSIDDGSSTVRDIGFNFTYEGVSYTQFSANSNGLIRLGGTAVSTAYSNNLTSTGNEPMLMPLWDDLSTGNNGSVSFGVSGSSPNRICVIDFKLFNTSATGSSYNLRFQAWLYETTNVIEFVYETGTTLPSASIGIGGATASNYMARNHLTNHTTASTGGINNITAWPGSGRKYTFTPPLPDLVPHPAASNWSGYAIVPRNTNDATTGSCLLPATLNQSCFMNWNTWNQSTTGPVVSSFFTRLYLDDVNIWNINPASLATNTWTAGLNCSQTVRGGRHTLKSITDADAQIAESNESNNTYEQQFVWTGTTLANSTGYSRSAPPVRGSGSFPNSDGFIVSRSFTSFPCVIGILNNTSGDNNDLLLDVSAPTSTSGYTGATKTASDGTTAEYIVVGSGGATTLYPSVVRNGTNGSSNYQINYNENNSALTLLSSQAGTISANNVANVWEFSCSSTGLYNILLTNTGGSADLTIGIYSQVSPFYYKKTEYIAGGWADATAAGGNEAIYNLTLTSGVKYAIVIAKKDGSYASNNVTYNLLITTPSSTLSNGAGTEPATISSITNTQDAAFLNFDFTFLDDGDTPATDANASQISQIIFKQGTGNDITTWTDAILGAELSDGTNSTTSATINAGNITFASIANSAGQLGHIADNASKTYTLKIWLKPSLGNTLPTNIDGQNFVFNVDNTSFTFTAGGLAANQSVSSASTENEVSVTATKLIFTTQPSSSVCINVNLAQAPIVKAVDANDNVDVDFTASIGLTNAGSLGMSNSSVSASAGVATFTNLQFTASGSAGVLTTTNGSGLTNGSSSTSITVNQTPATPGSITGTTAQCPGLTSQSYSIAAVSGATSYNWTVPTGWNITGGTGTATIQVTTGSAGQNGNIQVTAQNTCGTSSAQTLAVTVANGTPTAPTSNAFTNLGSTSFTANWSAATNATSYRLDVSTVSNFATFVSGYQDLNVGNVTTYSVTGLSASTKYYYRVRAVNSCGTSSSSSTQTAFTKKYLFTVGSGQEYSTIQSAMDDVYACWQTTSFDADVEVRVFNGTYAEAVTSNSALAPGTSGRLLIKAASGNTPIIDGGSSRARGIDISESYVTISGFTVRNHTADGIKIAGGNNIIEYNIVHNNGAYNIIIFGGGNNNEVAYNKCYSSAEAGIWVTASTSANIHHNLCYDHTKYGIYLSASANSAVVKNNTMYGNGSGGSSESTLSSQGFNDASNPTGWTTAIVADPGTDPVITYVVSSSYPSGYNKTEGANMVRFNSFTCASGAQMRLYQTSSFSTSGKTNIKVEFDWLLQNGYNKSNEGVLIQYSTNGSTWVDATFYPSYNATTGWTSISCVLPSGAENQANLYIGLLFKSEYGNDCYLDNLIIKGTSGGTATGSGLQIASSTNITSTNNIMYAKTGGDYYAVYVDGSSSLTASSGWNNVYTTGSKLGYYGSDQNTIGNWNTATPGSNDDISADPLFVTNGSDFHLQSEAASGTYTGGSWPPTSASGGTWTQYSGQHSPSIDAGNPADAFANESAYNGGRINQGCYGNTPHSSRTANDKNSKAVVPDSQIASGNIPSTSTNQGSGVDVFKFKISDLGANGDGLATKVSTIKITKSGGTADWTDHIAGAAIYYSGIEVTNTGVTIDDNAITLTFDPNVAQVANGTSAELTLRIWLNTANIVDNATMIFTVPQTSHGFIADATGSTFATDFGSAITGNTMTVRVTATKLIYADNMPPAVVPLNTGFPVKVLAVDDNNNLDSSATNSVTLSVYAPGTEILSSSTGLTQNVDFGTYQWNDVSYNTAQEFKIRATASGLTDGISILINCIDVPSAFSITAPLNANSCNGNITISWNASSGATSYDLYYSTGFDSDPQSCLTPLTNISSPYSFNASSPLTLYKFQILASNIVGQTWSSNVGSDSTRSSHAWIGGTSTDWTNTNNWCGGSIPNSSSDVIIFPGTLYQPTLTATSNVRNLTIETGASINTGSQNINVYGNWLNHGTLSGTGTVTFTGTAPTQTIENGNQVFYNLVVDKSIGSVVLNNDALLKNNFTITSGTLDANNFDITLEGNWNNSGSFIAQSGTVNFIGTGTSTITRVGSFETIFFDGFENGNQGWTMQSISSVADWKIQTGSANTGSYALGTYDLSSNTPNDYCRTCNMFYAIDVSRMIDLELYTNSSISFNYKQGSSTGGGLAGMVFLDGDLIFSNNIQRSSFISSGEVSINSYSGKKDLQLVFRLYVGNKTGLNAPGFIIDDLTIKASPNFELFNNVVFNKSGGAVQLNSDIVSENELLISNGTLNANGKIIRSKGDFINNGTFVHGNGDVQFNGNSTQHIKGSSNTSLYKMTKNGSGELIVGDDANNITITAENSFEWINNEDKLTIGNVTETSLIINDNLFIGTNCQLETQNNSTVSVLNHYKNFGTYTPNDGTIKFHNNVPSTIIKEPASIIYYENFESGTTGWTLGSVAGSDWRRQEGFGYKSNWDLAIYDNDYGFSHGYCYNCATNVVDASKVINLSGYNSVRLNFAYRIGGNSNDYGQVIIKVGSTEHVILDNLYNKLMWYEAETIDISEYANQSVTLIFRFKVSGLTPAAADPGFCIDEVLITTTSVHTETFNNLEINKLDDKSTTLWCPIIVNGNVLINQGDLNSAGFSFPVAGNWTANGSSTFTHNNNTITFNGSQNQTIINGASTSFFNIIINKTGTASLSSNTLKLDNSLTLTAGTLNSGNQNIEISGHWLNNGGVFEPMSQQVLFKGLSDQNITSRNGTVNPFYTIEMNKEGVLKLQDSLTLNKDLKLIKGLLDVNSTNNIRLKGDWIVGDGTTLGIFNPGSAMVTFDGIAPQHINRRTNGQTNLNDFTFFDVKIDGSNVTLWLKSSDYKINMNSLYIVKDKEFNVEGQE